jgi:hypothetical protein
MNGHRDGGVVFEECPDIRGHKSPHR